METDKKLCNTTEEKINVYLHSVWQRVNKNTISLTDYLAWLKVK